MEVDSVLDSSFPNCFSVDVEDYFQVSAFDDRISRTDWDKCECRVEASTDRLLRILGEADVRATFFILGWVADRFPGLIKRIQAGGHELASHGYWHRLVYSQTPEEFRSDLRASRDAIGNACGESVTAYRAPSFSITEKSIWALDVLAEEGFTVDSSIFPIRGHDRYGMPNAKREIHEVTTSKGMITEFPPSAWHLGRMNFPIGGGYFRIFPLAMTKLSISNVRRSGRPAMFYVHPWEIDVEQPKLEELSWKTRARHYTGLTRTAGRLKVLLKSYTFSTMRECLSQWQIQAQDNCQTKSWNE